MFCEPLFLKQKWLFSQLSALEIPALCSVEYAVSVVILTCCPGLCRSVKAAEGP